MTIWPDKRIVGEDGASVNRPDVAPSKETLALCKQALESLALREGEDIDEWAEKLARSVVPDVAPPKEITAELSVVFPTGEKERVMAELKGPPSDAAPVAWRSRDRNVPNQVWTLWNQGWEPTHGELNLRYTYDTSDLDAEVQALYAHPEDAPGGPWEHWEHILKGEGETDGS